MHRILIAILAALSFPLAAQTHSANLNWNYTQFQSDPATGFVVYRAPVGSTSFVSLNTIPVSQLTYSDKTVKAGFGYAYQVAAVDSSGAKSVSNTWNSPDIPVLPVQSTAATYASGHKLNTVTWVPSPDVGTLRIYRATSPTNVDCTTLSSYVLLTKGLSDSCGTTCNWKDRNVTAHTMYCYGLVVTITGSPDKSPMRYAGVMVP